MNPNYQSALAELRTLFTGSKGNGDYQKIIDAKDTVLERFGPIFKKEALINLTEEEFKSFLRFENNHHWTGLHRQGPRICSNMGKLRETLIILVDEEKVIQQRLDECVKSISGMGRAILTGILLIAYPNKYGVWNNTSERALKTLKVWPEYKRGTAFGERYVVLNDLLCQLAKDLGIDLWTLDALFWRVKSDSGELPPKPPIPSEVPGDQRFGLEVHLHDFLFDNWNRTELGRDWELYTEPGNPDAGYEYPTDVGEIDLLAKHKQGKRWLVVELKREQTSDNTVGQILRYIGWVRKHLAEEGERVEGVIIARTADERLRYAISEVGHVSLLQYEVSFRLVGMQKSI